MVRAGVSGGFTKARSKFARVQNPDMADSDLSDVDADDEEALRAKVARGGEDDDDEDEDDGDGGSDEEQEQEREPKRKKSAFIDDAAEDDEDDEEEEDERRPQKKAAKKARFNLVDDMAEVDEEEEDEDDGDDDTHDLIADERDEAELAAAENRTAAQRLANQQRQHDVFGTDEELERLIQERYGAQAAAGYGEEDHTGEGTEVEQQAMLPTVKDPKLWIVKCKPGTEREVCVQLMQKCIDKAGTKDALQIKSVLAQDHLKGYVYIESERQTHVDSACRGLRNIWSFKGVKLVPIGEMTEVMTTQSSSKSLLKASTKEENHYVRIKNGAYKGDLAQVLDVVYSENQATVKMVPRLDLSSLKEKMDGKKPPATRTRPPQRMFSKQEARDAGLAPIMQVNRLDRATGKLFDHLDALRFQGGYLIKQVSIASCAVEESPSFDELQRFHQDDDDRDGASASAAANAELVKLSKQAAASDNVKYVAGDTVKVTSGDLQNLQGTVERVDPDGQVVLKPALDDFTELIRFPATQLAKHFERGKHVKVTAGRHEGDTGMVVAVEEGVATLFTDITQEEVRVFTRDLTECVEEATGQTTFGPYELHDLVALDPSTVGLIVKVEREACRVLTNAGSAERPEVRTCRLPDLKRKLLARMNTAQDMHMNPVSTDDMVKILEGPLKGKQATVLHVHRGFLFARCREAMEHGGMICVRARSCAAHGGKTNVKPAGGGFTGAGGAMGVPQSPSHGLQDPMMHSSPFDARSPITGSPRGLQRGQGPQGGRGGFSGNARGARRDDSLVGCVQKVKKGPWKGYRGKVTDATDTTVRIELEAIMKTVTVKKSDLALNPAQMAAAGLAPALRPGETPPMGQSPYESQLMGSMTPARSMMTPARGDMTPMHGMATPMRESAWNPASATPMHAPSWQEEANVGMGSTPGATPGATASYNPAAAGPPGAYTPYDPHVYNGHPTTPGGEDGTPGYSQGTTASGDPIEGMDRGYTPSDVQYSPTSPSVNDGSLAPTPSMSPLSASASAASEPWPVVGLVVKLPAGETGVVRSVAPDGRCKVQTAKVDEHGKVKLEERETAALHTELTLVPPVKWDSVHVMRGVDKGLDAQLIGMDGVDAIIKSKDSKGAIKILDMALLGKLYDAVEHVVPEEPAAPQGN